MYARLNANEFLDLERLETSLLMALESAYSNYRKKEGFLSRFFGIFKIENINFKKIHVKSHIKFVLDYDARFLYDARNTLFFPIEIEAKSDLPHIKGNSNLLRRVFLNLLINAYDAMKESPEKKINIKAYCVSGNDDFVYIEFQDTGCGIPESYRQKVWEYLFTTKTHQGGSGIGLFWCKNIVENIHKGKIWFESQEGKGTTFFVKLPVWKDEILNHHGK
jgi:signal transduction histidine kinase